MHKLKFVFKLVGVLFAILLLALAVLVFTFDANNYKDTITAQVEKQTGRQFEIAGDISLSVFPWIGIQVEEVKLANAEGFSKEPFVRISQLDVKVMLLSLLHKELQVDKVRLHGLFASLEVNKDGGNNWSDLTAQEQSGPALTTQSQEQSGETVEKPPMLAALAINGVELVDATVLWNDEQNNVHSRLSGFDLITGAVRFNEPVDIQLKSTVNHNEPRLEALVDMTGKLTFNEAFTNILLDTLELNITANVPEIVQEQIDIAFQSDINIDLEQKIASLSNMQLSVMGATMHASIGVSSLLSEPVISGSVHTENINARELIRRLGVELPAMAKDSSLTRLAYASRIKADAEHIELDDIKLNLDDSEMTGWLHVPDLAQSMVRYKLHLSPINADAYLAPPSAETDMNAAPVPADGTAAAEATAGNTTADQEPDILLPVEMLRTLDLQGELTMESVTVSEIPLTDILMTTQVKAGILRIDPLQFKTLEGNAAASAMVNVNGKIPDYAIGLKASDIKPGPVINPMLVGIFGQKDVTMDGAANLLADIKTQGTRISQFKKSATGTLRFDMGKTILQGVDFEYYVRNVVADYLVSKSLAVPAEWRGNFDPETKTAFHRVHATAAVADGDITNKDLILDSSRIKVKGEGVINTVRNDMDYRSLVDIEPSRRQTTAEKLLDQPLAIRIHGPFEQLAYDVDKNQLKKTLGDMLEAEARAKIKKEIDEEKEKLRQKAKEEEEEYKQKLEDKLKDKLKGLF